MNLSKEERLLKNQERTKLIAEREKNKKLEEQQKIQDEINRNTINVALNNAQFTQVCKTAFFVTNTPTGRFDISFYSADIISLCKGEIVTKEVYDKVYNFLVVGINDEDLVEIVKRSTMFSGLVEQIKKGQI
jgi:hypothetical protein